MTINPHLRTFIFAFFEREREREGGGGPIGHLPTYSDEGVGDPRQDWGTCNLGTCLPGNQSCNLSATG